MVTLAELQQARKVQKNGGSSKVKKPNQDQLVKMKIQYENDTKFIDYMVSNPNSEPDDFRLSHGIENSHHGYSPSVDYLNGKFIVGVRYGLNRSFFMEAVGVSTADDVIANCDLKRAKKVASQQLQVLDQTEAKKLYALFIKDVDNRIHKTGDQDETKICTEWFKIISAR